MNRLYQWLSDRASFFHPDGTSRGVSRTVRTEVTVQREAVAMLLGGGAANPDICPLCGGKLAAAAAADQPQGRLLEGSISDEPPLRDGRLLEFDEAKFDKAKFDEAEFSED
jgi:hypothetical protein